MSRLIERPRRNGKVTLLKNLAETANSNEKIVSQEDFKGIPKRYKWVVANGEGIKKYFINKPRLIDHINGVYRAYYLGDKVTPAFRKKHRDGIGLEGGYKCLANIANGDGILRRED
ncbi:hypothetical protein [Psychrobacter sp. KCTC 72983]|uniref:hypothetical protein n=1 Tax=Psychrobacter sp. KCTC 72983 TaxID=2733866 RepID=UPI00164883CD|nr:hypothetical protein [Psychrobacter sp. KCTC 72983]